MRIVILSRGPKLYSTRRLREAAEAADHEVEVIDPLRCYVDITSHDPAIHYKGRELTDIDAVIPRIGASITFYGTAVVRQFEMMGVFPLNESVNSRDTPDGSIPLSDRRSRRCAALHLSSGLERPAGRVLPCAWAAGIARCAGTGAGFR